MTNTINLQKKAQLNLIVVGREGKMRVCRMRPDLPASKASNSTMDVPEGKTLRQAIMSLVADEIKKASAAFKANGRQVAIEVFTIGQVSIKYYQMVAFLKGGAYDAGAIEAIASERDNEADKCAYADLYDAIHQVIADGNSVHMQASGNAQFLELIIPAGVTVYDGQFLDFTDGKTADGIEVRGWTKCNRKGARVVVRGTQKPRAYIYKAEDPNRPWRGLETLLKTIDAVWKSLPKSGVNKADDDADEADLYAA